MLVKSWLFHTVLGPMALQVFFYTTTQCSSDLQVREVQAAVMGSVTITLNYNTYWYKNMISSWCRQVSMTECENIVDTSVVNQNGPFERVFISQTTDSIGVVNVTMVNLQHWDTGLYKWRIWTGKDYNIIENVLLQVVFGLPSKLHVAIFNAYDTVELNCEYNPNQKWSKAWYKMMGPDKLQWIVHSDGNSNMDYSSRSTVFVNDQMRVLVMKMTNLELWDSGFYQCRESGGGYILKEILLLITLEGMNDDKSLHTTVSVSLSSSTSSNIVQENSESKYVSPVDVKAHFTNAQNKNFTLDGKREHYRAWDILRWILFLCMVLCVVFFSYYKTFSERIAHVHQMCNRSFNKT
ncbi:uncharacterized protein ACNLHF_008517 [Anomaloglossus baeobatrachus]|uniref:uncharacterized protein LOC142289798 n=1 Tax=Anomaloglossus baeobatrachus TaxID=238106 RepID=UPI003F4F49FF